MPAQCLGLPSAVQLCGTRLFAVLCLHVSTLCSFPSEGNAACKDLFHLGKGAAANKPMGQALSSVACRRQHSSKPLRKDFCYCG